MLTLAIASEIAANETIIYLSNQVWFLFLIGFLGMIAHFIKKYNSIKEGMKSKSVLHGFYLYYFKLDALNTIYCLIGLVIGFFVMYQTNSQSVYAAFLTGFGSDSLLNKADGASIK